MHEVHREMTYWVLFTLSFMLLQYSFPNEISVGISRVHPVRSSKTSVYANRGKKMKDVKVDPDIVNRIRRMRLCAPAKRTSKQAPPIPKPKPKAKAEPRFRRSSPGKHTNERKKTGEYDIKFKLAGLYSEYGDLDDDTKNFLGRRGETKIRFIQSAHTEAQIPELDMPEVAFAGRSNVGKSSLLNAIGLTSIVRSSNTPGLTQSLNFYRLREQLSLVDLPGYGFAFAKDEKIAAWAELAQFYYKTRKNLRRVFVVLDARHGALDRDENFMKALSSYGNVKFQVILNKADLVLKPEDLAKQYEIIRQFLNDLPGAEKDIYMVSARSGAGIRELVQDIKSIALSE